MNFIKIVVLEILLREGLHIQNVLMRADDDYNAIMLFPCSVSHYKLCSFSIAC